MAQKGKSAEVTRFDLDEAALEVFFRRYEQQRLRHGVATTLHHVSPGQRIDAITAIVGLNQAQGWRRLANDSEKSLWLRYVKPVLAETRESAAALEAAATAGLPGTFYPTFPGPPPRRFRKRPKPREQGNSTDLGASEKASVGGSDNQHNQDLEILWRGRLAKLMRHVWQALRRGPVQLLVAVALAGCVVAGVYVTGGVEKLSERLRTSAIDSCFPACGDITDRIETDVRPVKPEPIVVPEPSTDPAGDAYRMALTVTLAAAAEYNNNLTPRMLAEIYAGESDVSGRPELFLAEMLKRWPEPPDGLIRQSGSRQVLEQYAAVFASIEIARRVAASPLDRGNQEDNVLEQRLADYPANDLPARQSSASTEDWPAWLPYTVFGLLVPALLVAAFTFPAAVRASLANPPEGLRGKPFSLPLDGLVLSTPLPDRKLARGISWREPVEGRRMHADLSIRATLAAGGFLSIVMRRRTLLAEYVFLVRRLWPEDHEAARVSRLIETLSRAGANITTYDYDPDPRTITARPRSENASTATFDLRGLRERHPDARLVLVTDGSELVDYFTLTPLPFVAEELATWPGRMHLTPVPIAEWGEREMKISKAFDAPIGRATATGFKELATIFGERRKPVPRRVAFRRAVGSFAATGIEPVVAWLVEARRRAWTGSEPAARPTAIRLDEPYLRSDVPPPPNIVAVLVDELHRWLGTRGFYWLAACAHYPELRFPVTTYLGWKIETDHGGIKVPLYNEDLLAQLTLLPWFRFGHMPPWLGNALLASLTDTAFGTVQKAVDDMLNGETLHQVAHPLPKEAHLPIWLAGGGVLDIPMEAVVANVLHPDQAPRAPRLGAQAMAKLLRPHRLYALSVRVLALAGGATWCTAAWWLWPDTLASPNGQGAWLPLSALLLVTALAGVWLGLSRLLRSRRATASEAMRSELLPSSDPATRDSEPEGEGALPLPDEMDQPVRLTTRSGPEVPSEASSGTDLKI